MYKVLLVDDERIILEGISAVVDWEGCGTRLIGTARNGLEAKAFIEEERPDIIITDIRMPGMDGLQLVEQVTETDPDMFFIMLSGFGDFDYARTAMRCGVKHYLTKPCNERAISEALREAAAALDKRLSREQFIRQTEERLQRVLPRAREQLLKELVTNKMYGKPDWERNARLFGMPPEGVRVRLLLYETEGETDFEHLFALRNIAEDLLAGTLLLGSTIGRQVLLLLHDGTDPDLLYGCIEEIKKTFGRYYKLEATAALSEPGDISEVRRMYRETMECLAYRFYLGEGGLITKRELEASPAPQTDPPAYDEEKFSLMMKSGQWMQASELLEQVFESLASQRPSAAVAKSYLIPLYIAAVRQGDASLLNDRLKAIARFDELETLQAMKAFIIGEVRSICEANFERHRSKHSDIVAKLTACVQDHIANPDLSLHWAAKEVLFMNPDYLGKLFRKETGEKFSSYVTRLRIEKAIEMIADADDVKVYELADRLGFGDNPQYFSQVFKKATGCSPSEFKRAL